MSSRAFAVLAGIAAIEGVALAGYALFELVEAVRLGVTGPAEVSNPAAITLQIAIFGVFGVGLLLIARGWLRRSRWVRGPFVLAQIIALVVGVPLVQANGAVERVAGVAIVFLAIAGIVLTFTKPVMAVFTERR